MGRVHLRCYAELNDYLPQGSRQRALEVPLSDKATVCNGMLLPVDKDRADLEVPTRVRILFDAFWRCDGCGRVYWQGSHYERLRALVEQLAEGSPDRTES